MVILKFLGMYIVDFIIGKIFDTVTEIGISDEIKVPQICKLGAPFVGALK